MEPERWRRIEEIFQEAADLRVGEIPAFLDSACDGDPALRGEVENLLESDRKAQQGIKAAVDQAASSMTDDFRRELSAYIGMRIGPYQIVREIGRGGMGAVYQAVRVDEEYLQAVAIKFVAQGMDTPESLQRFRVERQILATLHHPNIAGLLDGGATEDGRPYFVMEYIEGEPLIDYSRKHELTVEQRLELFRSICAAVHHAHQMLVIHRDIKPHNVLVTSDGIPKLLDFGIAKLLAPELVPGAGSPTRTQMRMLTPEYASPEQIRGETLTTASDIYSLGVLLYELLTYASPYRTTSRSSREIEHAVCDDQPRRLTEAVREPRLRRKLAGDLENIVAMAMRKEPQRRYGSVLQLSDDIQRYLKGLPISARKDTPLYLAGKLMRRNKLASAAFALLALSVVGGLAATVREAQRTERRFQEVRKLANAVLFDFHSKIQHLPGSTPAREMLVRTALDYLNSLSRESGDDPTLEWEISQAYELVGDVQGDPGGANLGKYPEALSSYHRARAIVSRIAEQKRTYETLSCLTWLHYKIGDLEFRTEGAARSIRSYGEGLKVAQAIGAEIRHRNADDLLRNGYQRMAAAMLRSDYRAALESARLALDAANRTAQKRPGSGASANLARGRMQLANILWITGDLQGAMHHYQSALADFEKLLQERPDHAATMLDLQEAYRRTGDLLGNPSFFHFDQPERALEYHRKSLKLAEQMVARDPADAQALAALSNALRRVGAVLRGSNPAESAAHYQRAVATIERLMKEAPGDRTYMRDLPNSRLGLAISLRGMRKPKEALKELEAVVAAQRQMLDSHPDRSVVREDMFDALLALGDLRLELWDGAALEFFQEAMDTARQLTQRTPDSLYAQRCLALASRGMGDYYTRLAQRGPAATREQSRRDAEMWYGKALSIWSGWRTRGVGLPYSANREREILRVLKSAPGYNNRAASLAK